MMSALGFSQDSGVKGMITDSESLEELVGVNIVTADLQGTVSDIDGSYILKLKPGSYTINVSSVGYNSHQFEVTITAGTFEKIDISLEPEVYEFDALVVSGSRFEKRASEEVISIEVIKPEFIDKVNATQLDDLARRVSGLNVVDGQANIRSGSGWAYGVGSRVAIVVDGQPFLTPDRGGVKWQYLPIESVGQIEVLKGASSVLYGSSAMNGTIHLQSRRASTTPETKVVVYNTYVLPPRRRETKWWGNFPLMSVGTYFSRTHKPKPNFEYLVGGHFYSRKQHYERGDEYLARMNFNTRWTSKKDAAMYYGVRGNVNVTKETEFFFWQNGFEGALKPKEINVNEYFQFNIDPYFGKFDKKGNKHELNTRFYYWKPSFDLKAFQFNANYIFSREFPKRFNFLAGVNPQYSYVYDDNFGGDPHNAIVLALYTQIDKKFDKLTLTGGLRSEFFSFTNFKGTTYALTYEKNDTVNPVPFPLMRFGLNYNPRKNTFVRFNIGQAFRFPSVAERFVEEKLGDFGIFSNPGLKPEYGWTAEIGFKQNIPSRNKKVNSSLDAAFFWQEYKDLIEFGLGFFVPDSLKDQPVNPIDFLGFRGDNVSQARIAGIELTGNFDVNHNDHQLHLRAGYSYSYPIDLSRDIDSSYTPVGSYLKHLFQDFKPIKNLPEDHQEPYLRYRNRHLFTADMEYTWKNLTLGMDCRYYSFMEKFDDFFELADAIDVIPDIQDYVLGKNNKGDFILGLRAFYTIKERHTFGMNVKNVTNREFYQRPSKLESPASITIQYKASF